MDLDKRMLRLLESLVGEPLENFKHSLDQGLRDWENRLGINPESDPPKRKTSKENPFGHQRPSTKGSTKYSDLMLKDLAAFGLTPPVSLSELKKARNRELKKFHPDRFAQEPEKLESAGRIAQILGDTYERLAKELK